MSELKVKLNPKIINVCTNIQLTPVKPLIAFLKNAMEHHLLTTQATSGPSPCSTPQLSPQNFSGLSSVDVNKVNRAASSLVCLFVHELSKACFG